MKEKLKIQPGVEGFATTVDHSLRQLAPHHHEELEVNLVLTGKANYLFGNRRVPLLPSSMIWLFPKQEHVLVDWSHDFSMWVVVFKPGLVEREAGRGDRRILRVGDPGDIFCRQVDSRRVDFLSQVYHGAAGENQDREFINATLSYALVASWQAFRFSSESIPRSDVHPAVGKAVRLIANAGRSIPLEPLARQAGLSAPRLSRLFKRQMGMSLTAFQQQECLKRFLRVYRTGARYTLIEAALLAGFGSYAQFHRVFCRSMGMNPMAYRKREINRPS